MHGVVIVVAVVKVAVVEVVVLVAVVRVVLVAVSVVVEVLVAVVPVAVVVVVVSVPVTRNGTTRLQPSHCLTLPKRASALHNGLSQGEPARPSAPLPVAFSPLTRGGESARTAAS
jgi:hypothetical protein